MADAIALIVAGSGEVSDKEVFDLIEDWYQGLGEGVDVSLVIPVTKNDFTDAVEYAAAWYLSDEDADPKDILTIKIEGSNLSRNTSQYGDGNPEVVENFGDIFADDFKDFDTVEFFIALPGADADDYDEHVAWLESANDSEREINIRDLCAALDDVVVLEPEDATADAAPEPEPEPEKPARRGRSRKVAEPVEEKPAEPVEEPEEVKPARKSRAKKTDVVSETMRASVEIPELGEVLAALREVGKYLDLADVSNALFFQQELEERPLNARYRKAVQSLTDFLVGVGGDEAEKTAEEPAEAPKRGRGRPRQNFEVKEIYDEDEKSWIPRPRGRIAAGTEWRVRHDETNEILDKGTT